MAEIKSSWAVCSVCGKEFEIVGNRKKYCSKACCAEARKLGMSYGEYVATGGRRNNG